MKTKKGFTLIELLVVIAIIALLLAILLPSLSKVKETAMFVVCKTGLHQYGLGGAMYLSENDENFPHPYRWLYDPSKLSAPLCAWHDISNDYEQNPEKAGVLWPYLASKKMHVCPKFRRIAKVYGHQHNGHGSSSLPIEPQYSYCMNGYLGEGPYSADGMKKSTSVKVPANTFFFCEENTWEITGFSVISLNNNNFIGWHNGTYNAVFATFHGMKGSYENPSDPYDPKNAKSSGYSSAVFLDGSVRKVLKEDTQRLGWPK